MKSLLRIMVRSFYDAQKLRIEMGNRIVANVRVKLGQAPGAKTEEMPEEGQQFLKQLVAEYKRITDGLIGKTAKVVTEAIKQQDGVITNLFEYKLVENYLKLLDVEEEIGKTIAKTVQSFPIWDNFLKDVKGCGPAMAAVIISELDPHKARHVSSFWKYAGLDVAEDGKGRSRKAEHLVEVTYLNKEGKTATRRSITFNPFLKTKLIGVLGSSFLRSNSPYRLIYDGYKHRLDTDPRCSEMTKGHKHNRAVRYMIKMFLKDLWVAWRKIEGLPVTPDYAEAKLGIKHTG